MNNLAKNKLTKVWKTWSNELKVKDLPLFSLDSVSDLMANIFCPGPFYFYLFDFTKFEFIYVHPSIEPILGLSQEEANFENISQLLHPDDLLHVEQCEKMAAYFLFNYLNPNEIENYKVSYCYRLRNQKGGYKLILHQAIGHTQDENKGLIIVLGVHTDVSHLMNSNNRKMSFSHIRNGPSFLGIDPSVQELKQISNSNYSLTNREKQVLNYLSEGDTVKMISTKLVLSEHTIRTHRNNIRKKMGCQNTTQMVANAIREGLI